MTQAIPKTTFEDFLDWKPDRRYELYEGIIVEMQPTGKHEELVGFLATELAVEYKKLKLPYFIPKTALVKIENRPSAYCPDVLILNRPALKDESLWEKYSTVQTAASIPLVVEVVLKDTAMRKRPQVALKDTALHKDSASTCGQVLCLGLRILALIGGMII